MTKRTYVQQTDSAPTNAERLKRLMQRGVVKVSLAEVAEAFGDGRSTDAAANNVRAGLFNAWGGALLGCISTSVDGSEVMEIRVIAGSTPDFTNVKRVPRTIQRMVENDNKFSPTIAAALRARNIEVAVNPQASELVQA